jgi:hypothetical protein
MIPAFAALGLHTNTTDEARALVPMLTLLPARSVRIGHVPVMPKPAPIKPLSIVSHPVDVTAASALSSSSTDSVCLNA